PLARRISDHSDQPLARAVSAQVWRGRLLIRLMELMAVSAAHLIPEQNAPLLDAGEIASICFRLRFERRFCRKRQDDFLKLLLLFRSILGHFLLHESRHFPFFMFGSSEI